MAVSIIGPKFYAWDSDTGKPLAFGKVYTYQAGTNTPKATFTTEGGETQNANPVILNGAGYADIYLNGSYKIVVKDADDVEVWTSDPVSDPSQLQQEWVRQRNITQVNTTTFTVDGELTDEYVKGVAVRVKQDSGFVTGTVSTATYADGKTTVVLDFPGTETIDTSASYAERALVSFQSFPKNLGDRTISVGSVADLIAVVNPADGAEYRVISYHPGWNALSTEPVGGGSFVYVAARDKSDHNGGTIIDPDKTFPANWGVSADVNAWFTADGTGTGCFVRSKSREYNLSDFGWINDVDASPALDSIFNAIPATGGHINLPAGSTRITKTHQISKPISISGVGHGITDGSGAWSRVIKDASVAGPGIIVGYPGSVLSKFTLQGESGNTGDGITILNSRVRLDEVAVYSMGGDGVRIGDDTTYYNCNLFDLSLCKLKNNGGRGIYINQENSNGLAAEANIGQLSNCDVQSNAAEGILVAAGAGNLFLNVTSQTNGKHGIRFTTALAKKNVIIGGDYEVNARVNGLAQYADIKIDAGAKGNKLIGVESYNDPSSVEIDEPETIILGLSSVSAGYVNDEFMGLHLANIESANPRVMDWYEEGVFTPVIVGATAAGTATYTDQAGKFTRVGNVVTFNIDVSWSGHTGTGTMRVTGLPYPPSGSGVSPVTVLPAGIQIPANSYIGAHILAQETFITMVSVNTNSASSVSSTFSNLAMDSDGTLRISGSYIVD